MKCNCQTIEPMFIGCNNEKNIHHLIINDVLYIIRSYQRIIKNSL